MRSSSDQSLSSHSDLFKSIPRFLTCPISLEIYFDPVTVAPSGHTYEREMLVKLIKTAEAKGTKPLCPLSKQPIESYVTAWGIKSAVADYLDEHPDAKQEQYQPKQIETQEAAEKGEHSNSREEIETIELLTALDTISREDKITVNPPHREASHREESRYHHTLYTREAAERERRKGEEIARKAAQRAKAEEEEKNFPLYGIEKKERDDLINDLQNLIYALKFEKGPQPRGRIDNFSLLFFAMIEQAFLAPQPWQKIKVADKPKNNDMYNVLKAAIQALQGLKPSILDDAKERAKGRYDLVQTKLGGQLSLSNGGYASLAVWMGTVKDQPGYLVDQLLLRVNHLLLNLCQSHANELERRDENTIRMRKA